MPDACEELYIRVYIYIYIYIYLALINRTGGLYGRILTEVVSTDRGSLSICGQSPLRKKAVNKYIKAPYVTSQTHSSYCKHLLFGILYSSL